MPRPSWSHATRCAALAAFLLCASNALAGEALFASRIYYPEPMPQGPIAWTGPTPVEVSVRTADGLTLRGFWWAPAMPEAGVIVFFHGNAGNRATAARMAEPLARDGKGLLVASYRGYGDHAGTPSQDGLFKDGAAFLAKARALAPEAPIVLFGYSLGGAVALELGARENVRGVVTLGAFASLRQLAPRLVAGLLEGVYDNQSAIRRVDEPVLVLHGTADEVVPFEQARALQAAAPRARLLRLEGSAHRIGLETLAAMVWANIAQMPD